MNKNLLLKGIVASQGIAIGKVFLVNQDHLELSHYNIATNKEIEKEINRFKKAIEESQSQLLRAKKDINKKKFKEAQYIIDTHILLLQDKVLMDNTIKIIKHEKIDAALALKKTIAGLRTHLAEINDEYMKERTSDIDYIEQRLLRNLAGIKRDIVAKIREKVIIVASDLSPADTANLNVNEVLGFTIDSGGRTSHTAIMARALKIPAVVGLKDITRRVKTGDTMILDGIHGVVIINPTADTLLKYNQKKAEYDEFEIGLLKHKDLPGETIDGFRVKLMANIEIMEELPSVLTYGAEGIGLYRTEFLYLNRKDLPSEAEQFEIYKTVSQKIAPHPVTIRTLDIGGDKFMSHIDVAEEINPVMGLRAIRFCLKEVAIFKTQLRAIMRSSAYGKVKIMFPMISGIEEVRQIKIILSEVKKELQAEHKVFDPDIEIGIMVEVPSAASIADILAKEVNFFSIGTNDLIQYTLAIDRVNENVSYLYEPLHPAVLRLLRNIINAAHDNGIPVAMCGEMAGEPFYMPILLGLGIDELSMNVMALPRVKSVLRSLDYKQSQLVTDSIFKLSTAQEIETLLKKEVKKHFPRIFN
ncbi:MAG: phosphoenolpyruvate--protein phosphotransferase [Proteobacteria bacterium]|jgi:phosphoenolpyruvate-protein phosphotransferase (PTS system enzyme I)|nr:phosphoenolpyruvate--protein phosphotransferase [Pseudomonadota bacterium]